jgi:hypothetical protein
MILQSFSTDQNEKNIEIPMYHQLNQENDCKICDTFITGTAELNCIDKSTLLQHKSRLLIQEFNKGLQQAIKFLIQKLMNCYCHQEQE